MKRALLQSLVAAHESNQSLVLIRGLTSGRQFAVAENDIVGDTDDIPAELLRRGRNALGRDGALTVDIAAERYLLQTLSPPPRLIIVGAVHIAQQLIPMARIAGYDVQLIDPRTAFATPARFPGVDVINDWPQEVMAGLSIDSRTAIVTLSHDPKIDEPALSAALQSEAFYVGALGSRKNHASRLKRLAESGFGDKALGRIAGPIGLPLGGRSPAEIAVSILAQIIQARYCHEAA
jgi:xanthine dehydrogenase accessory factor